MSVVKITNKIALVSVGLLIYWVFIFITSTVFGFKTLGQNLTELFLLSILGIFSILSGAIILNVMHNLTAIAEGRGNETTKNGIKTKSLAAFVVSLVVILVLLFAGDFATAKKNEKLLVMSASDLVEEQLDIVVRLANYSFSNEYIEAASYNIKLLSRVDQKFPNITVIVEDDIDEKPFLLGFTDHSRIVENKVPQRVDFILSTTSEERKYLQSVFRDGVNDHRFDASERFHQLYYPVTTENGVMVLHLSQHARYGKFGS